MTITITEGTIWVLIGLFFFFFAFVLLNKVIDDFDLDRRRSFVFCFIFGASVFSGFALAAGFTSL